MLTMPFHLFQYPLPAEGSLDELNRFLGQQRVATVTHHIVNLSGTAILVFVVETVATEAKPSGRRARIDYRDELNAEDFEVFRRLREARKRLAEAEGVPVYAVFTNAQLAAMAQARCREATDLLAIEGIGQARVDRYAATILAALAAAVDNDGGES